MSISFGLSELRAAGSGGAPLTGAYRGFCRGIYIYTYLCTYISLYVYKYMYIYIQGNIGIII